MDTNSKPASPARFLGLTTVAGSPVEVDGRTVTPVARILTVRWRQGGAFWAWPCAVRVSAGGRTRQSRIPNTTRRVQTAIVVAAVLTACGLARHLRPGRRDRSG